MAEQFESQYRVSRQTRTLQRRSLGAAVDAAAQLVHALGSFGVFFGALDVAAGNVHAHLDAIADEALAKYLAQLVLGLRKSEVRSLTYGSGSAEEDPLRSRAKCESVQLNAKYVLKLRNLYMS